MGALFAQRIGTGSPVVLVHGVVQFGELTWRGQLPLAERWELHVVERPGYGCSRHVHDGEDVTVDGPLIADLLCDSAHLVGQSSGAVASSLAAAHRPAFEAVCDALAERIGAKRAHVPAPSTRRLTRVRRSTRASRRF